MRVPNILPFVLVLTIQVNKGPDYSAAFVIFRTNFPNLKAYGMYTRCLPLTLPPNSEWKCVGMAFTSGSGNEVVCLAMKTLAQRIVGKSLAELTENMARTWRSLVSGQIRWIGPEVYISPFYELGSNNVSLVERSDSHGNWGCGQCDLGSMGSI